ncbi:hypothetical protein D3C81_1774080 [compost metagenome]
MKCTLHLMVIMYLKQRIKTNGRSNCHKVLKLLIVQNSRDQQYCIRANKTCFVNLPFINNKIFPKQRYINMTTNFCQIFRTPLKIVAVCKHRHTIRTRSLIFPGKLYRMKIWTNQSFRRRSLLHLGNETQIPLTAFCKCIMKSASRIEFRYFSLGFL